MVIYSTGIEKKQYLDRVVRSMESLKEIAVDLSMFDEQIQGEDEVRL